MKQTSEGQQAEYCYVSMQFQQQQANYWSAAARMRAAFSRQHGEIDVNKITVDKESNRSSRGIQSRQSQSKKNKKVDHDDERKCDDFQRPADSDNAVVSCHLFVKVITYVLRAIQPKEGV